MKQVNFFALAILLSIYVHVAVAQQIHNRNNTTNKNAKKEEAGEEESIITSSLHAKQQWFKLMQKPGVNYFAVKKAYDDYFKKHPLESSAPKEYGLSWLKTKLFYLDVHGRVQEKPSINFNQLAKAKFTPIVTVTDTTMGTWRMLGPRNTTHVGAGLGNNGGYAYCVRIDPTDANKLFCSFVTGGLWVSADNGVAWHLADANLPADSYYDIDVCKANNTVVYAIGPSAVIKSTDGGMSWNATALNKTNYTGKAYDIAVSPTNANVVVARWGTTVYRTTDGGTTWTVIKTGLKDFSIWDSDLNSEVLDWDNNNSNTVYFTDRGDNQNYVDVYKSTDSGVTFSLFKTLTLSASATGTITGWSKICTATNNTSAVYVLIGSGSDAYGHHAVQMYKLDVATGNITLQRVNMVDGINTAYGSPTSLHHGDIAMDINDENKIAWGSYSQQNVQYSTNNGVSFSTSTTSVHSDLRGVFMMGGKVMLGTDGSAYVSTDNGNNFSIVTNSISNHELWGFGSAFKSDMLAAGCNHGPLMLREYEAAGGWYTLLGADQGNSDFNPLDSVSAYSQGYDSYHVTRTGIKTYTNGAQQIDPGGIYSYFNTLEFQPNLYHTLITHHAGGYPSSVPQATRDIWKNSLIRSDDNGLTVRVVYTFSSQLFREKICMTDTNRIYAVVGLSNNSLMKTTNGGTSFTDITPSTAVTGTSVRNISDVAVSDVNPDEIWVSYSGVQNTCQVLHSTDGGVTYTNLTQSVLTSNPVTKIIFQRGTNGGLYVANASGVYYRNNVMANWVKLGSGLPDMNIRFMFINYYKGKLLIGTSRGAWDNDLYEHSATKAQISADKRITQCSQPVKFRDYSVVKSGAGVSYSWVFTGGTPSTSTLENPTVTYATGGTYTVSLTVTDQYGSSTQTLNNFIIVSGCINDCNNPGDIPHTSWQLVYTDSQQSTTGDGAATSAFDNDPNTMWHTRYSPVVDPYPHEIQIDLGTTYRISKFRYLPRQSGTNGYVANYEVYVSSSTSSWGTPVATGTFANDATEKTVTFTAKDGRYLRFRALSEVNGQAFASAAEINVVGCIAPICSSPQEISQTAWRLVSVSSQETAAENGAAVNAFDGNPATKWHTQYTPTTAQYPHEIQIDMNAPYAISQIKYLPRQDGGVNGRVANYEIYISSSTSSWGTAVATGTMANDATEKTISFTEKTGRYIRFRALSEVNGNPWASAAEIKAVGCPIQTCPSANDNIVNDAFSSAVQIPLNTDIYGKITPSGDNDFYKFVITTGGTITLTLSTLPANYDVRLYNSAQTQVGISQNNGTTSETINYTAAAGTYYVKVYGSGNANNASSCYDLKVTTGTASFMNVRNISDGEGALSDKKAIEVSPNPAKNILNIKLAGYNSSLVAQVFDMVGSMVLQKRVDTENTAMDISKLTSGVYLVKFFDNDKQVYSVKIIKE